MPINNLNRHKILWKQDVSLQHKRKHMETVTRASNTTQTRNSTNEKSLRAVPSYNQPSPSSLSKQTSIGINSHQQPPPTSFRRVARTRHLTAQPCIRRSRKIPAIEYRSPAEALHLPLHARRAVAERRACVDATFDRQGIRVWLLDEQNAGEHAVDEAALVGEVEGQVGGHDRG